MRVLIRDGDRVVELDTQGVSISPALVTHEAQELWRVLGFPLPALTERKMREAAEALTERKMRQARQAEVDWAEAARRGERAFTDRAQAAYDGWSASACDVVPSNVAPDPGSAATAVIPLASGADETSEFRPFGVR